MFEVIKSLLELLKPREGFQHVKLERKELRLAKKKLRIAKRMYKQIRKEFKKGGLTNEETEILNELKNRILNRQKELI